MPIVYQQIPVENEHKFQQKYNYIPEKDKPKLIFAAMHILVEYLSIAMSPD